MGGGHGPLRFSSPQIRQCGRLKRLYIGLYANADDNVSFSVNARFTCTLLYADAGLRDFLSPAPSAGGTTTTDGHSHESTETDTSDQDDSDDDDGDVSEEEEKEDDDDNDDDHHRRHTDERPAREVWPTTADDSNTAMKKSRRKTSFD